MIEAFVKFVPLFSWTSFRGHDHLPEGTIHALLCLTARSSRCLLPREEVLPHDT